MNYDIDLKCIRYDIKNLEPTPKLLFRLFAFFEEFLGFYGHLIFNPRLKILERSKNFFDSSNYFQTY